MRAEVTNFGPTRAFPTCIGNVFIGATETRVIESEKAISELRNFPLLKIDCGPREVIRTAVDWTTFSINQLRSVASRYRIRGFFTMKKPVLVKALKEKYDGQ